MIFAISTPLVVLAAVGGALGVTASARQQAIPSLSIFGQVQSLIVSSYVEPVDVDKLMDGAMRGLADDLDPESAYLSPSEVTLVQSNTPPAPADVGVTVTRNFYLRVLGVRDGSPAARAGLRTGDYIRAIDGRSTREMSAFTGRRALAGAAGSKISLAVIRGNAAEPHTFDMVREVPHADPVTARRLPGGESLIHIASFSAGAAPRLKAAIDAARQAGADRLILDVRGTADGSTDEAIAAARLFVKTGTIAIRAARGDVRTTTAAEPGDGAVTLPVAVLVSSGTAGPAEVFAAAIAGNHRGDLVGSRTAGTASVQKLIPLPDASGLWLTSERYLTIDGAPIFGRGLLPTIGVDEPAGSFAEPPPAGDAALDAAVTHLKGKRAA